MERIGPRKPPRLFIKEWMAEKNLTQRRLAERLDCGEGTVSKLLRGEMEMTQTWLAGIAWALDREVVDMYRHPNQPSAEDLLRDLPADKKAQALEFIRFLKAG